MNTSNYEKTQLNFNSDCRGLTLVVHTWGVENRSDICRDLHRVHHTPKAAFLSALAKDMQFVKPNSNYTYSGGRLFQCCNSWVWL